MKENLRVVKGAFSAYLNQDFDLLFGTFDDAIRAFVERSAREDVSRAAEEIGVLLAMTLSEDEKQKFIFEELGCYYYYPAEWPSTELWLQHIVRLLDVSHEGTFGVF